MSRNKWHNCQPGDLHALARNWFMHARRIEMQQLARELGVSRATAYRWAGSYEQLVGEILANLVDQTFGHLVQRTTSRGSERVLEVLEQGMRYVHRFEPLRKFLTSNPQVALKIVTSKHGPVQARTIANVERLLQTEIDSGHLTLPVATGIMAYAITRMVESFLYTDLITGAEPDLTNASRILRVMLGQT